MITWLTNGHSLGKKVPLVSKAIACHISLSPLLYFISLLEISPYRVLVYFWSLLFELRNLSSVPTQKYETDSKMIFSNIASLLSSWLLSMCKLSSSRLMGNKCMTLPILRLKIQSSYSLTPRIVFTLFFSWEKSDNVEPFMPLVL